MSRLFRCHWIVWVGLMMCCDISPTIAQENTLTTQEVADGWILLFDGKSTRGWLDSKQRPVSDAHVQDHALNPHPCDYMLIHEEAQGNFVLALEFRLSEGCNSGVFVRTFPLTPRPGKDVGFNGIEIAIDDTTTAGFHDTGAIYDLVQPRVNAMKPAGEWNSMQVTCNNEIIEVEVNGQSVTHMNLDQWTQPGKRPDESSHKFDVAWRDHPRRGYLGLQDHGQDVWYRNIRLRKLP